MRFHIVTSSLMAVVLSLAMAACSKTPNQSAAAPDPNAPAGSGTTAPAPGDAAAVPAGSMAAAAAPGQEKTDAGEPQLSDRSSSVPAPEPVTVPAGTVVNVRLGASLSSATAVPGETFDATLDGPLVVNGRVVAAAGTAVTGRVMEARASGRLHDSGYLRVALASIDIHGRQVPIATSSVFAQGTNHNRRNATMIGGGAGVGALIGGLAGGGKGALIGGLVGAGAGTGGAYATGKKDVEFAAERRLSFRLTEAVNVKG